MKKIYRLFASAALLVVVLTVCIVPAYADPVTDILWGIIEWSVTPESTWEDEDLAVMLRRMWPSSIATDTIKISYDELQELCTSLNMAGYPCHISRSNTYYAIVGEGNVTGLGFTFSIENRFCANTEGHVFVAETNTNVISALNIIGTAVQNVYDRLNTLVNTLAMQDPLEEWLKLFHAQIEVVQLRQELANVQLDELIEAVKNISISADGATINLDTLPIVNKLDDVITAIEDISINVEGGTVNFDTNPITDKLDEVIDALHDISVEGAFCDHTFVDSGQYTYRGIFPTTPDVFYEWEADENGWYEFPYIELVPGETYQVYYDGELYQCVAVDNEQGGTIYQRSTYIGNQVINDQALGGTYPFSIRNQLVYPTNEIKTTIKPLYEGRPDISISQRVSLSHCSKCGTLEDGSDLLQIIGTINNAATTISHAFFEFSNFDFFELTQLLSFNQSEIVSKLDVIAENLVPGSACEHSYMPVVLLEPSCEFPGVTKFTCDYCGTYRIEPTRPLGHEWEEDAVDVPEVVEPVALFEDAPFGLIEGSSPPMLGNYKIITLTPGNVYTVIYGGVEYVTVCSTVDYNGLPLTVIGNIDAFFGTGDNGCPFVIASSEEFGGSGCFDFSGATFVRLSVYAGTFPSDTEEEEPSAPDSFRVCSRCDSGSKFSTLMAFLDERLTSSPGGGSDLTPVLSRMDTIIESLGADLGAAGCEHVYLAEVNQEQTCVLPGLQTHTCELCGSSYSEILESLGHDWQCTQHVEDELDPETGEVISSGYDIYTCSICDDTYNDYDGNGAPEDGSTSITGIVSRVFEKIGSLVGELLAMGVRLLDNLLTGFDEIVTSFNEKTQQIVSFGSGYTAWLSGFWGIVPSDLQLALSFCVVVICLGIIGKKVVFAS